MKKKTVLTASLILLCGFLKAQSVTISTDNTKISFLITEKTTKAELKKADDIFAENGISTDLKRPHFKTEHTRAVRSRKCNLPYGEC